MSSTTTATSSTATSSTATTTSREAWMQHCVHALSSWLSVLGHDVPQNLRVGCGWPAGLHESAVLAACYSPDVSRDGTFEIFVSPSIDEPLQVAAALAHEIIHAIMGMDEGHGARFASVVRSIGLEGPASATVPGPTFRGWFEAISTSLGPYPHAALVVPQEPNEPNDPASPASPPPSSRPRRIGGPKPQKGRLLKVVCPECGYVARVTRVWLTSSGAPICPTHHVSMVEC